MLILPEEKKQKLFNWLCYLTGNEETRHGTVKYEVEMVRVITQRALRAGEERQAAPGFSHPVCRD